MEDRRRHGMQQPDENESLISRRGFYLMVVVIVVWFLIGILAALGTTMFDMDSILAPLLESPYSD